MFGFRLTISDPLVPGDVAITGEVNPEQEGTQGSKRQNDDVDAEDPVTKRPKKAKQKKKVKFDDVSQF